MNPTAEAAYRSVCASFQAINDRARVADLERRVTGDVPPVACFYCGRGGATFGPARDGYRVCPHCSASERAVGGETRLRHLVAVVALEGAGLIGPNDTIPPIEGPVYADLPSSTPARPLTTPWSFFTEAIVTDLAYRAGRAPA